MAKDRPYLREVSLEREGLESYDEYLPGSKPLARAC